MQTLKITTLLATALLVGGTMLAPEAKAYDPCQRAINDANETYAAWHRWMVNNCPMGTGGACRNNQRGAFLFNQFEEARGRVHRYCR